MKFYYKYYYQIIISIAAAILLAALILQYKFNFAPCLICYYQRVPYIFIILCAILGYILGNKIKLLILSLM